MKFVRAMNIFCPARLKAVTFGAVALFALVMQHAPVFAQTPAFEKKNFHYNEWTKGRFAEAVTVTGPGKWVFLAGVGSEAEKDGSILHQGDFLAQCRYAYEKIRKLLAQQGATMADVVKLVSYVTDIRSREDLNKCRAEAFAGGPLPVHTFLAISQLARPGMLVEMDVIAVTSKNP
jgi:enamine deaminase RidA (YjgF/YER057c/UK114 family)